MRIVGDNVNAIGPEIGNVAPWMSRALREYCALDNEVQSIRVMNTKRQRRSIRLNRDYALPYLVLDIPMEMLLRDRRGDIADGTRRLAHKPAIEGCRHGARLEVRFAPAFVHVGEAGGVP